MHAWAFDSIEICKSREAASDMMMNKCLITRLFVRKGCDINEAYKEFIIIRMLNQGRLKLYGSLEFEKPLSQNESQYIKLWLSFLRDQNISVEYCADVPNMDSTNLQAAISLFNSSERDRYFADRTRVTEMVFMLCALGADVSATGTDLSLPPLHFIADIHYSPDMAFFIKTLFKILLDFGADPCARTKSGWTVLHIAWVNGWVIQWIEALIECNQLQVVMEQFRAGKLGREEEPLHTAMRTGVDVTDLSKPSAQGLSRRIASRGDRLDD